MVAKVADHSDNMFKEDAKGVPCSSSLLIFLATGSHRGWGLACSSFFLKLTSPPRSTKQHHLGEQTSAKRF